MKDTMLRLDANEGRCALPPEILAGLLEPELARRYPDPRPLEEAIAERLGIEPGRVAATAGADDAIDRAIRALCGKGGLVLSTEPGFEEYAAAAARSGARYGFVAREPGKPLPLPALLAAISEEAPSLLIVASPDNPGGGVLSLPELVSLSSALAAGGGVLLLDATYAAFASDQEIYARALGLPKVIIAGSFSKSHGLAGFRAGWAVAEEGLVGILKKGGPPYSISSPAIAAALAALRLGDPGLAVFIARVAAEREVLATELSRLGAESWRSEGNFVSALVADPAGLAASLAGQGILIRTWKGKPGREKLVRITCPGEEAAFGALLAALGKAEGIS